MENKRFTANDAMKIANNNVINNLEPKQREAYNTVVNKIKELLYQGIRHWVVNDDNEYYKYLYQNVLDILSNDGFTIVDNYADEEWDYKYFGKIISW